MLLVDRVHVAKDVKREITVPEQGCKQRTKYGKNERSAVGNSRHAACTHEPSSPSLHGLRGGLVGWQGSEQPASCSEVVAVLPWSCCCCHQARVLPWGRVRLAVFLSAAFQPVAYVLLRCAGARSAERSRSRSRCCSMRGELW